MDKGAPSGTSPKESLRRQSRRSDTPPEAMLGIAKRPITLTSSH